MTGLKHIPICSTKGCPHPSDPDWHRCFVCNKEPIDHQHYPKKSLAGKGATIVAALCRYHHERITLHEWREGVYRHGDGSLRYYIQNLKGETMCDVVIEEGAKDADRETPKELSSEVVASEEAAQDSEDEAFPQDAGDHGGELHGVVGQAAPQRVHQGEPDLDAEGLGDIDPGEPALPSEIDATPLIQIGATDEKALVEPGACDWAAVPDEQLAALFAEADKRQAEGFLLKCRIVHTFRERHVQAWGESWTESAYELFHISRRTLNAYANLHEICDTSDPYLVENIGPLTDSRNLMSLIGRKKPEDGKRTLEAAVAYLAKYAEAPTVPALLHLMGEEAKPDLCPEGGEHEWERKCRKCGEEK